MARQGAMGVEDLILNKVAALRRWKKTNLYKRQSKWDFTFTVMTYNILSQNALHCHMYLYRKCDPAYLSEEYRVSRILPEILRSRSDVICLQEVEQQVYDYSIRSFFDLNGFASIFKRRTRSRSDGCAILWRRNKFDLMDHNAIEFRTKGVKLLDRDNVGLIAVLRPRHPKSRNTLLHVATTHLLFNSKRGDIKLCQLRWLLAELERMSLKETNAGVRSYHPVILCGDFNFEPDSPLYQFVENGHIDVSSFSSGDLSGQPEGRNKGQSLNGVNLGLQKLGISDSTRFERSLPQEESPSDASAQTKEPPEVDLTSLAHKIDPSLIAAMGSSVDDRWYKTLLALSKEKLDESASHTEVQNENSDSNASAASSPAPADDSSCSIVEAPSQRFSHDFKFVPAYKFHDDRKSNPITSLTGDDKNCVDQIFYTVKKKRDARSFDEGRLRLLSVLSLMHAEDLKELGGLPNAALGSDHVKLMATFAVKL